MIKYTGGKKYHSHCQKVARKAVVIITCDPGVQRVCLEPSEYKLQFGDYFCGKLFAKIMKLFSQIQNSSPLRYLRNKIYTIKTYV